MTKQFRAILPRLRGRVLDVGGGRPAPHDDAWPAGVLRFRLDVSPVHRPDVVADAGALPFRDGSFDGAVACEVLEHIAEPQRVIDELHRVLVPGGDVWGSVPFLAAIHGDPDDYYRYTASSLAHLFRRFSSQAAEPHGNAFGAAWTLLTTRVRALRLLNPVARAVVGRAGDRCPEGYVFNARR